MAFEDSPLVRTDFGDEDAWESLVRAATAESPDGFRAELRIIEDERFSGWSTGELIAQIQIWEGASVLFVADTAALGDEHPILCVDLAGEPGRAFRCIPAELWGVENNLRLSNMDWEDFAEAVDQKGVHRGFD